MSRVCSIKACEERSAVKFDECASGRHRGRLRLSVYLSVHACQADSDAAATCFISHIDDVKNAHSVYRS